MKKKPIMNPRLVKMAEIVTDIVNNEPPKDILKKVHSLQEMANQVGDRALIGSLVSYEDHLNKKLSTIHL